MTSEEQYLAVFKAVAAGTFVSTPDNRDAVSELIGAGHLEVSDFTILGGEPDIRPTFITPAGKALFDLLLQKTGEA